jgi:hypothetical protein
VQNQLEIQLERQVKLKFFSNVLQVFSDDRGCFSLMVTEALNVIIGNYMWYRHRELVLRFWCY